MAKQANPKSWGLFPHTDGSRRSYPQSSDFSSALRDLNNRINASADVVIPGGGDSLYGLPLLFHDNFESGGFSHTQNGISHASRVAVTNSTDNKFTGTRSARFTFSGNAAGGDTTSEARINLGAVYREIEFQWMQYIPDGTESYGGAAYVIRNENPSNNKQIRVWRGNQSDGNNGYASFYNKVGCSTDEGTIARMFGEYGVNGGGMGIAGSTGNGPLAPSSNTYWTAADRGTWKKFGYYARACITGTDGVIALHKDDVLIGITTNLPFLPSTASNAGFDFCYLMGWANSGFLNTTHIFIDDLKIFGVP